MFNCFTQDESRFLQESTRFQPQNLVWPQGEEVTKGAKGVWQINKDIIISIIIGLVCLFGQKSRAFKAKNNGHRNFTNISKKTFFDAFP